MTSDLLSWQAESLRLTAFTNEEAQPDRFKFWKDLVGQLPDVSNWQRKQGILREEGPFEDRKLISVVQPFRFDWLLAAGDREQENEEEEKQREGPILQVEPFDESLELFLPLMINWLEGSDSINRIAFGAILLQPIKNRQDGYRRVGEYLPSLRLDPEGSSDFFYRINRPRASKSGIPDLKINRLSKWSVAHRRETFTTITPEAARHSTGQGYFACRLELDINTPPGFQGELPSEQLPDIFRELVELGKEIAAEGDAP